jgi:hypothetical protein
VVLRWNEVLLQAVKADRTPPPRAARNLAMVHGAVYDAVNAVEKTHHYYQVDAVLGGPASAEVAAAVAAHRVLVGLYPRQAARFNAALDASLRGVPEGPAKGRGMRLGQAVAERVVQWRQRDGSGRTVEHTPGTAAGVWRPTPPGFRPGLLPQWPSVTPFALREIASFRPRPPPALTSAAYAADCNEVKDLGGRASTRRTAEQTLIAWFWDDGEGSVTPPGHWNRIAQTVARARGTTMAENARLFALLNIALADAAIVCWDCKFEFNFWRPITAIHEADRAGNPDVRPDAGWAPLLTTPPFPSYTSGHSTFSGAAAAVLAHFFGTDDVRFTSESDGLPGHSRSFASFSAAAAEAGRSRIYGGIHYEFDNREGLALGRALAGRVCRDWLRPRADRPERATALTPARTPR